MNRLTACLSAVALAATASLLGPAPAAQAARAPQVTTQRVTANDLGPGRAWLRLRDDPTTTRHPGVEEIAALAAPDRFDGSLHLKAGPGQQSQAAHYFTTPVALRTLLASGISYDSYVDGAHTTAVRTGAGLQLPMLCHGAFTTLSFQPQLATDGRGRGGVVPDVWQHWESGPDGIWRTSRAIPGHEAGQDAPLGEFADACGSDTSGVVGLIGNAGGPGESAGTLDTYVDNLTLEGITYDFAVDGTTSADVTLHHAPNTPAGHRISGLATFRTPAVGPRFRGVGARFVLDDSAGLDPGDVRVSVDGTALSVTRLPGGSLVAATPAALGHELRPGAALAVPFTITLPRGVGGPPATSTAGPATLRRGAGASGDVRHHGDGGSGGAEGRSLSVSAELLADGFGPLRNTGVHGSATIDF
ncbi:hypothetical protein [Streptomyces sp. NBC_01497]|uniref:hypothetical protein n=1 Tax=Streptomyces sp. NBC_01497 TaxID=2903885 RepID=UPI002E32991F|nr:hypothetical protein [Streptomyces sp. NBC_01497]